MRRHSSWGESSPAAFHRGKSPCGMPWGLWCHCRADGAGLVGSDQPTSAALPLRQMPNAGAQSGRTWKSPVHYLLLAIQWVSSIPIGVSASTYQWAASTESGWFVPEVEAVEAVEAIPTILRGSLGTAESG